VVEGTGLENRQTRKRLEGSNPSPSANFSSIKFRLRPKSKVHHFVKMRLLFWTLPLRSATIRLSLVGWFVGYTLGGHFEQRQT
jgi:hypothetical protein